MNNRKLFNDKDELESSMLNFVNLQKENKTLSKHKFDSKESFINEKLVVDYKDYYFSNVVARSSKTMIDCHNSKIKIKKTGTDG
jgi:NADH-quinone oxidoreductase subunit G